MYRVIYLYPVPKPNMNKFIQINKKASLIYKQHGAVEDDTFQSTFVDSVYGCVGMRSSVRLDKNEMLMVSISTFHDQDHHNRVMEKVDNDKEIIDLYHEMLTVIDMSRVVRGEFEKV